jgi:hypothetical protein
MPHPSKYRNPAQPALEGMELPPERPLTWAERNEIWKAERKLRTEAVRLARTEFVGQSLIAQVLSTKDIKAVLKSGIDVPGYGEVSDYGMHESNIVLNAGLKTWKEITGNRSYRPIPITGTPLDVACPTCMKGKRGKKCEKSAKRPVEADGFHQTRTDLWESK